MTSPSRPRTPSLYHAAPGPSLSAAGALALVLAAIATLILLHQIVLRIAAPLAAAAAGQLGMLALALLVLRAARLPPAALGIAPAPPRFLAAGALIGVSLWYANLALVEALVPVEPEDVVTLQRLVEQPPLPAVLAALALAPAVCEEVLFRGALLRGLASRISPAAALLVASVMFSIYHVKPVQMLPTFTLGLALGVLALRAGSILPSVIAHLLNNAMAIVVHRQVSEPLSRGIAEHPLLALAGFGALLVAGTAIAVASPLAGTPVPRTGAP